ANNLDMTIVEITGTCCALRAASPAFHSKSSPSALQSRVLVSRLGRARVAVSPTPRRVPCIVSSRRSRPRAPASATAEGLLFAKAAFQIVECEAIVDQEVF